MALAFVAPKQHCRLLNSLFFEGFGHSVAFFLWRMRITNADHPMQADLFFFFSTKFWGGFQCSTASVFVSRCFCDHLNDISEAIACWGRTSIHSLASGFVLVGLYCCYYRVAVFKSSQDLPDKSCQEFYCPSQRVMWMTFNGPENPTAAVHKQKIRMLF